ncbi:helix-turn-helix transcriptional regulator [Sphaerisporangium perillae]|uniref:helix-turn-helix transcriptional regulator n=1 Tax=Sphaerisporangium perillae TaxID=2935860 RepID=UPI00200EDD9E|nr:LuxR family transcriptional regulator [Sphaerisporangium perillae]
MRGREPEWQIVSRLLRTAEDGGGGTLLIEGEPGTGKSLLLAEAATQASRRGFALATGRAERLDPFIPLTSPFLALDKPSAPPPGAGEALAGGWEPRIRILERLRIRLTQGRAGRPVLISLDDLQWADTATLAALCGLHHELGSRRVVWLLSRSVTGRGYRRPEAASVRTGGPASGPPPHEAPQEGGEETELLFGVLEQHGATRLALRPLPEDVVAVVAADVLGAVPQPDLLALAAGARGNPYLLVELLQGLREEGAVEISGGRARLLCPEPPERVRSVVRHRLGALGREARQLIEVAAVLGRRFSPEDVAELVGTTPAALLPAVEEALDAGILLATDETLEFRQELAWRAVLADLPPPMRHALHHQIGQNLLNRGGSAEEAAGHLIEGTRPGDPRTLAGLDQAVTEVLATSPCAAADLAVQAVELSDLTDPGRPARVVTAIEATTEAGRLADAGRLVRAALTRPVSAPAAAELHCALSGILFMGGRADEAVTEAEAALREPTLPVHLRDRATLALLYALAGLPDSRRAVQEAEKVLMAAEHHGEAVAVGATVVLAMIRWEAGHLADGLSLAREAVRRARGGPVPVRRTHPRLALASMLADIRRLDEARAVLREAGEEVEALGHSAWEAGPAVLRARIELIAGRLDDAVAEARAGLDLTEALGSHLFGPLAARVLGEVALRQGDLRAAAQHLDAGQGLPSRHAGPAPAPHVVAAARITEARDGPAAAMRRLAPLCAGLGRQPGVLVGEPACAPWLARVALAAGDRESARLAVAAAERLADGNPGFLTMRTAATHARGLLEGDAEALGLAAKEGADPWARASAAEDLGVTLAAGGDRQGAVRSLDQALACYEESGSTRDAARLRRRLRRMGVRHRHWATADRPVTGWASLTETERAVSLLVTQGWTNRQVADQMFISVHTVAFHLRQIFRKLGIGSRVELTRFVLEQDHDAGPERH